METHFDLACRRCPGLRTVLDKVRSSAAQRASAHGCTGLEAMTLGLGGRISPHGYNGPIEFKDADRDIMLFDHLPEEEAEELDSMYAHQLLSNMVQFEADGLTVVSLNPTMARAFAETEIRSVPRSFLRSPWGTFFLDLSGSGLSYKYPQGTGGEGRPIAGIYVTLEAGALTSSIVEALPPEGSRVSLLDVVRRHSGCISGLHGLDDFLYDLSKSDWWEGPNGRPVLSDSREPKDRCNRVSMLALHHGIDQEEVEGALKWLDAVMLVGVKGAREKPMPALFNHSVNLEEFFSLTAAAVKGALNDEPTRDRLALLALQEMGSNHSGRSHEDCMYLGFKLTRIIVNTILYAQSPTGWADIVECSSVEEAEAALERHRALLSRAEASRGGKARKRLEKAARRELRTYEKLRYKTVEIGARAGASAELREMMSADNAKMRSHVRRGHWHGHRVGPMKDDLGANIEKHERKLVLRWHPPSWVSGIDDTPHP